MPKAQSGQYRTNQTINIGYGFNKFEHWYQSTRFDEDLQENHNNFQVRDLSRWKKRYVTEISQDHGTYNLRVGIETFQGRRQGL